MNPHAENPSPPLSVTRLERQSHKPSVRADLGFFVEVRGARILTREEAAEEFRKLKEALG